MSSLTEIDKRFLEKILHMGGGYVLDFTDSTFDEFFRRHNIDIHSTRYQTYGSSKARKMRAFWEQEPDQVVGNALSEMLDSYEADCEINQRAVDSGVLARSQAIVFRLSGKAPAIAATEKASFLEKEFTIPNIHKLPIEAPVASIIEVRLEEARKALRVGAHLSVIFLCGSVLEGVLLGAAQKNPKKFNKSPTSPKKDNGKVKPFHEWSLAQFIDTACDIQLFKLDDKKFSHGLRDFRNYIHPYEQMVSGFTPDQHTAKVCFQVLKAALASMVGDRQ